MLKPILDNLTKEKILFLTYTHGEVYARSIATTFGIHLLSVQNQLKKLERGGVMASRLKGQTRLYSFNPRYPFLKELKILLAKAMEFFPEDENKKYFMPRKRPRRSGKPL